MMDSEDSKVQKQEGPSISGDLEKLLEERARLEDIIQRKFTRTITIMFTDMKGSSSIAESEGDMFGRYLIKKHNDILFPIIKENRGVLVKTMGDGTLSYFEDSRDAVYTATRIQQGIDMFNHSRPTKAALQIRIGLNTGTGIVEKNDIFGDAVNIASRFQTMAMPGEIYISENTYDSLIDKDEFYCRHIKTTQLREMRGTYKVFKVYWDQAEIAREKSQNASAIDQAEDLGETISIDTFNREVTARKKDVGQKESIALHKAKSLEKEKELVELYLFCQAFTIKEIEDIYQNLNSELKRSERIETKFNGENALWFFKETIIIGRVPEADFPLTNKAISRVPIQIGISNGEGFLKIEGSKEVKSIELEKSDKTEIVRSDARYSLGKSGKIIFSVCFPLEYNVYRDRFLIVRVLPPEECINKHFNFKLKDVWKDFEYESEKIVVIGL